jgi:putative ABC transport system ATP-binding protein
MRLRPRLRPRDGNGDRAPETSAVGDGLPIPPPRPGNLGNHAGVGNHAGLKGLATVLEVRDAVKEYGGTPPVRALDGVSFDIVAGEMVAVVGPSGSGKSTLLHLIGALDRPSDGTVRVAGADVGKLRDKELSALRSRRIGFVFQQFHLLHGLTAVENVASGLVYRGTSPSERRRRAAHALERVGLGHRVTHHPAQMSGGEQQRVAIARAIVGEPAIVLADEPTGNLDSATGMGVLDVFRDLHFAGTTIVLITHDPNVAAAAPRVVALRDGKVESDGRGGPS